MKIRKSIIASIGLVSLFYFSTQPVFATELDESELIEDGDGVIEDNTIEEVETTEESNKPTDEVVEENELSEDKSIENTPAESTEEVVEDNTIIEEKKDKKQETEVSTFSSRSVQSKPLTFEEGDRHDGIIELKVKLNAIGFDNISETDYYGGWTTTRVEQFQANYGLPVTGVADEATQEKLDEVYNSPFQIGGSDPEMVSLKEKLNLMGFDGISLTENYGNWTKTRVKEFQSFIGLKDNGIADAYTRQKLDEFLLTGFGKGDTHHSIVDMKQKLNALGFDGITETTYFGNWTATRVKQFQENYGLPNTGRANAETLAKMDEILNNSFYVGSQNDAIIDMKKKLNRMGFDRISETANYGSWTATRVKQFQRFVGLKDNGIADPITLQKLDELVSQGYKKGDTHEVLVKLKENLNALGFDRIQETDYYGNWTKTRVEQFQQYYGLDVTGRVNGATFDKIDEIIKSPLQQGKRHNDLIQLKHNLNWLDYGYITVTDFYGSFTEKKVKQFQRDHDLPVSGIAEPNTVAKINQVLEAAFQPGNRHNGIIILKEHLNDIGFGGISVTNLYGDFTAQRVSEFQAYYGLGVTGIADKETLNKITSVVESPFQQGKRHDKTIVLKENLNRLGFGYITVTNLYGSFTEKQVKAFQNYYGLVANGIADERTFAKIDELLNSPFQQGKEHQDTVTLKENLNRLGFGYITVTPLYGSFTEKQVRVFQEYYGLAVNGIADERTFAKIKEILNSPFQEGKEHKDTVQIKEYLNLLGFGPLDNTTLYDAATVEAVTNFQKQFGLRVNGIVDEVTFSLLQETATAKEIYISTNYNISLNEALNIQMKVKPQSDKYYTGYISSKYLKVYDGGTITGYYVNLRKTPEVKNGNVYGAVEAGATFKILDDNVPGTKYGNSTRWYKIEYQGEILYVHSTLANLTGKVGETTVRVNVRAGQGTSYQVYETVNVGKTFAVLSQGKNWTKVKLAYAWRNATSADTKSYLDPTKFVNDDNQKFQFLDLRYFTGVPADELNSLLEKGGILKGQGEVFRQAAKDAKINEIYLISHALLETGNGTSKLAQGYKYNGKTVYNFFGIGAKDSCALECGAKTAYDNGWFTVKDAIIGGAKFAGEKYINAGQNTLYTMRWNPAAMVKNGYATHQYATDIGWASKQISYYKNIYDKGVYNLIFDVPVYK